MTLYEEYVSLNSQNIATNSDANYIDYMDQYSDMSECSDD